MFGKYLNSATSVFKQAMKNPVSQHTLAGGLGGAVGGAWGSEDGNKISGAIMGGVGGALGGRWGQKAEMMRGSNTMKGLMRNVGSVIKQDYRGARMLANQGINKIRAMGR